MILSGDDKVAILHALTSVAVAHERAGEVGKAEDAWALQDRFLEACAFEGATATIAEAADKLAAIQVAA